MLFYLILVFRNFFFILLFNLIFFVILFIFFLIFLYRFVILLIKLIFIVKKVFAVYLINFVEYKLVVIIGIVFKLLGFWRKEGGVKFWFMIGEYNCEIVFILLILFEFIMILFG